MEENTEKKGTTEELKTGNCIECGSKIVEKENKVLYLALSKFQKQIEEHTEKVKNSWRINAQNETLKYLKGDEGDVEVFFIAGADSLMDIEKWKNPELVLSNCTFVAFNRGEYNKETLEGQKKKLQDKYNSNIILLDISNLDISSSKLLIFRMIGITRFTSRSLYVLKNFPICLTPSFCKIFLLYYITISLVFQENFSNHFQKSPLPLPLSWNNLGLPS